MIIPIDCEKNRVLIVTLDRKQYSVGIEMSEHETGGGGALSTQSFIGNSFSSQITNFRTADVLSLC